MPQYTLAIETATQKGSLSLLKDGEEIAHWVGDNSRTLSSTLLPQIAELLSANALELKNIDLIAVSAGPGSFTGARIGLAVALALKTSLEIPARSASLAAAMAWSVKDRSSQIISVIPASRNEVYWQQFSANDTGIDLSSEINNCLIEDFADLLSVKDSLWICTSDLKPEYRDAIESRAGKRVHVAEDNLAKAVGHVAVYQPDLAEDGLSPIYVKEFRVGS